MACCCSDRPGAGNALLARTILALLPPLTDDKALAATIVDSVAAVMPVTGLVRRRLLRGPHHTSNDELSE